MMAPGDLGMSCPPGKVAWPSLLAALGVTSPQAGTVIRCFEAGSVPGWPLP